MTDRTPWILFFSAVGCGLSTIVIVLLLLRKRHAAPRGDSGWNPTSIDQVHSDAARNQQATQASIRASRLETAKASDGIRNQMDVNQMSNVLDIKHSNEKLNWIKAMIARWFSLVKTPAEPPSDEPGKKP
jgi:hypothetical protein